MRNLGAAALIAAVLMQPGVAAANDASGYAQRSATQARYDIYQFDVAGVRLGMTFAEAEKALLDAGYPDTWTDKLVDTFEQTVRNAVSSRTGKASTGPRDQALGGGLSSSLPTGESVMVWLTATPSGHRVSKVQFLLSRERMEAATFERLALSKYGKESWGSPGLLQHAWCDESEKACRPSAFATHATLKANTFVQNSLTLEEGTTFYESIEKARRDALEARAPKAKQAAF